MTSAQSDDATDPEVDPDAAVAAVELAVLLADPIKGGIDPRHGGHFSFKEHYVVLDLATGDQLLDHYFHGAESRWRYSTHSLVRGFEGHDGGGPHGDESPLATTLGPETQSSAKSGHLATKVVSSFQLDSPTPGQERSVTALVTGVRSFTADTTAASTSMYTKGSFASSSAPENSHTPQQPKVGGDDETVSTDLSVSPQNDKIVQNSEQNAATHVTPSPGAEYSLWNREKEVNDAYDAYLHGSTRSHDDYEDTDMFGPLIGRW
jgi:hypothetical protein